MPETLDFDQATSNALEAQYRRPMAVLRRAQALRLADPRPAERAVDVGCGPGFVCADLAAGVGEDGQVVGVDSSEAMLSLAKVRCSGYPQVRLELSDATSLPVEDGAFDLVVSTQVLEYVADVDRAIAEMARCLRPGGRVVLLATDWRSLAWHTDDQERMDRVLSAWEEHLSHPALPRTLAGRLQRHGIRVDTIERNSVVEWGDQARGFSTMFLGAIAAFVPGRRGVTQDEAEAWAAEQVALREAGDFYFSLGQYFFCATKSA